VEWVKRGLIFEPASQAPWIGTHAALPVMQAMGDRHRLFFSSRDRRGRSHIGFIELSLDDPRDVLGLSAGPVISPGPLGTFDDAGVTSACLIEHDGCLYFYYTGWSLGASVPFYLNVGLARSDDGGLSFRKISPAPVLDRSSVDPYLTASPWVLVENGTWRMWYVSGTEWADSPTGPIHRYHIKYAESSDGLRWDRRGVVCIDYGSPDEHAFGRPCVVRDGDRYRMWYSYRGSHYRIGYAESTDGIAWTRMDMENVLSVSDTGWDSEMVTYPLIISHHNRMHMLYNGNGYGRTGIGLAQSTST
jgi:predicted GH43/DUF377 family glycosyl hydrolase